MDITLYRNKKLCRRRMEWGVKDKLSNVLKNNEIFFFFFYFIDFYVVERDSSLLFTTNWFSFALTIILRMIIYWQVNKEQSRDLKIYVYVFRILYCWCYFKDFTSMLTEQAEVVEEFSCFFFRVVRNFIVKATREATKRKLST